MSTPAAPAPTTWLVERTLRSKADAPIWETVAGYSSKASAREHVAQCRRHSFLQGYALRVTEA